MHESENDVLRWGAMKNENLTLSNFLTTLEKYKLENDSIISIKDFYRHFRTHLRVSNKMGTDLLPGIDTLNTLSTLRERIVPPSSYSNFGR